MRSAAGMTTGAIYGNFKNRDELFIALGETYWAPIRPKITPGATFAEAMRALRKATLAAVEERTPAAVGRLTGLAYTLKNPELRATRARDHEKQLRDWRRVAAHVRRHVSYRCRPIISCACFMH